MDRKILIGLGVFTTIAVIVLIVVLSKKNSQEAPKTTGFLGDLVCKAENASLAKCNVDKTALNLQIGSLKQQVTSLQSANTTLNKKLTDCDVSLANMPSLIIIPVPSAQSGEDGVYDVTIISHIYSQYFDVGNNLGYRARWTTRMETSPYIYTGRLYTNNNKITFTFRSTNPPILYKYTFN